MNRPIAPGPRREVAPVRSHDVAVSEAITTFSEAEYLALEERSEVRHEFLAAAFARWPVARSDTSWRSRRSFGGFIRERGHRTGAPSPTGSFACRLGITSTPDGDDRVRQSRPSAA